ncbi:MAG: hypothetical protein AAF487_10335, partial [Bacteroidota bacterium]
FFHTEIAKIQFELSGCELLAALREDELIKKHWPKYNKAQKKPQKQFGIFEYLDQNNVSRLGIQKCTALTKPIEKFYSEWAARNRLIELVKEFDLISKYCGLPEFINSSAVEIHNKGIENWKEKLSNEEQSFLFKCQGRNREEDAFVFVESNLYKGFGYVSKNREIKNNTEVKNLIEFGVSSSLSNSIVSAFIAKNNPELIEI